jgi:hypothetical protein
LDKEAAAKHREKRRRNKTKRHQPPQNQTVCEKQREATKGEPKTTPKSQAKFLRSKNNYYFRQNKNSQNQINRHLIATRK